MSMSISNPPTSPIVTDPISAPLPLPRETTSIDDHTLPKSVVVRLAKSVLPENTMIQKEAVTALVKSATVFVNYLAATANDVTQQKGKKTINNEEVLTALEIVELDAMIPQLKAHIEHFEVARREKRKKAAEDEEGRKRRRREGEGNGDVSIRTNGDDGDTEVEKNSEDGESADERDEHDDHDDAEADLEDAEGEDEPEVGGESLGIIDMEEHDEKSDGGESDEALAEDSD